MNSGSTMVTSPRASCSTERSGLVSYSSGVMRPRRSRMAATEVSSVSCSSAPPRTR
jgi:hypothetical protein